VARKDALDLVAYLQSLNRVHAQGGGAEEVRDEGYALSRGDNK